MYGSKILLTYILLYLYSPNRYNPYRSTWVGSDVDRRSYLGRKCTFFTAYHVCEYGASQI